MMADDSALLSDDVRPPGKNHKRRRKRGPRSSDALLRRSCTRRIGEPVSSRQVASTSGVYLPRDGDSRESEFYPSSFDCSFTIFHTNIRVC